MEKSTFDKVMTVFKVLILVVITLYLAYSAVMLVTAEQETGWEVIGFVVLFVFGIYVNGGALALSLIMLIASLISSSDFKKRNVVHFLLLMLYAVASEAAIYVLGTIVFK